MRLISPNTRLATTVVAFSALLALGACGKKENTSTNPGTMPPSAATPANTAPSVTTTAPDTSASGSIGTVVPSSAPTSMAPYPVVPASGASAAK